MKKTQYLLHANITSFTVLPSAAASIAVAAATAEGVKAVVGVPAGAVIDVEVAAAAAEAVVVAKEVAAAVVVAVAAVDRAVLGYLSMGALIPAEAVSLIPAVSSELSSVKQLVLTLNSVPPSSCRRASTCCALGIRGSISRLRSRLWRSISFVSFREHVDLTLSLVRVVGGSIIHVSYLPGKTSSVNGGFCKRGAIPSSPRSSNKCPVTSKSTAWEADQTHHCFFQRGASFHRSARLVPLVSMPAGNSFSRIHFGENFSFAFVVSLPATSSLSRIRFGQNSSLAIEFCCDQDLE